MQISREQSANNMIMQNLIKDVRPKIFSYEKRHNINKNTEENVCYNFFSHNNEKKSDQYRK